MTTATPIATSQKKVIVVGGGIAGLSAGIYAQKCGFDTTIIESHSIPGGNCTSWKRGGYLFEGGMHWLTGSDTKDPTNALWRYTGALDDSVVIHVDEPFMEYDFQGTPIRFYRDIDKTEQHLKDISPADAKEIETLCGYMRKVQNFAMPVTDLRGVKITNRSRMTLSSLFSAIPALFLVKKLTGISRNDYIKRFSHEGIRDLLRSSTNEDTGILPPVFTMGTLARGDGGFPEGGSLPFARRMADTFTGSGGRILYNTRVERVLVESRKAVGVVAGGEQLEADAIIVTVDTMQMDHLFDTPPQAKWLDDMRSRTKPTMCTFVSLGIDADLRSYEHAYVFKPKEPLTLADQTHEFLCVNNYAADPFYSPEGKTAMTTQLGGDTYEFWKQAKEKDRYEAEKQRIGEKVVEAVTAQMPEAAGKVEICDVATPLTYERYCANWKGSWMTEMTSDISMKSYPAVVEGLSGVYFAGHRMMPPGGLPVALMSGRAAVQYLCRDTDTLFVSEG